VFGALLPQTVDSISYGSGINTSPAANTMATLAAQGYTQYCDGLYVAWPVWARATGHESATLLSGEQIPDAPHDAFEPGLLRDHAAYGCVTFWCVTSQRAHPFVFGRRLAKGVLPCAQLVYCRDTADVARFAGLVGRHLATRLSPLVVIDAVGPRQDLPGLYLSGRPKYFKGPSRPRLGDLAYTEAALFGV